MFSNLYNALFVLYLILLIARISGIRMIEVLSLIIALCLNFITLVTLCIKSGDFPVFSIFETLMMVSFILGCLGGLLLFKGFFSAKVRLWVWLEIIILFCIMLPFTKEAGPGLYDSRYIYIVLFHITRCISQALMLFATAWFIQFIIQREMDERTSMLSHQGRNYLLLSAVFFFISEYVGIIWCQNGWGDFWMWSKTFLQSTIVVLYLMLAFHIPGKGRRSEDIRCVIGGLSGIFMITLSVARYFF